MKDVENKTVITHTNAIHKSPPTHTQYIRAPILHIELRVLCVPPHAVAVPVVIDFLRM